MSPFPSDALKRIQGSARANPAAAEDLGRALFLHGRARQWIGEFMDDSRQVFGGNQIVERRRKKEYLTGVAGLVTHRGERSTTAAIFLGVSAPKRKGYLQPL